MAAGDDLRRYLIVPTDPSPFPHPSTLDSVPTSEDSIGGHQSQGLYEPSSIPRADTAPPAKRSRMEVDTQPSAPLPGQILSMEEFLTQRRPSEAQVQPQPQPLAQPTPEPRIISARSSKNTIELHEKYQALGIPRPEFVFQGGSVEGWVVKTVFLGRELSVQEPCGSKQEAKEKLSEVCLKVVKEMEEAGELVKTPRGKKGKKGGEEPVTQTEKESGINYIGQLLEFQRSTNTPQPTYTDFQLGQSFSCEVTLSSHPHPFGSRTTFFTSKRAARHHAAACAVAHFQAEGTWPTTFTEVGGIRKKKASIPNAANAENQIASPTSPTDPSTTSSSKTGTTPTPSFAHRVSTLSTLLSLPAPQYIFSPPSPFAPPTPGFHTVACYFRDAGPHSGPLGEVRNVFGRKRAKEECARGVVEYLEGVKERRLEYARKVVGGVVGETEGVLREGLGRGVEGEGEGESSGEEGWASAVEEVE